MSFKHEPIIDRYAVNSETSVRRFQDIINLTTGFLSRPEYPDKGCDLTVELFVDGKGASSWLFPVQIKSIEKTALVREKTMISLPFETSRLGYLMRRLPAMGLIVFYSLEEDRCFFEYADRVYDRLMEERNSHNWKEREEVHIHIPCSNVLTLEAAKEIHQIFLNRFRQAQVLQNSHGKKYDLPTFSVSEDFQYDFRNPDHIKIFLKEFGMELINDYEIDLVFQMISKIPHLEIYDSKELLFIAAIAYERYGLYSESNTFCHKLSKLSLNASEKLMFGFIGLKNRLSLGYIDSERFVSEIHKLKAANIGPHNEIVLDYCTTELLVLNLDDAAIFNYNKAIELNSNWAQAYIRIGTHLINQGKLPEALDYLLSGYENIHPKNISLMLAIGEIYERMGEFLIANEWFEGASNLKPIDQNVVNKLGSIQNKISGLIKRDPKGLELHSYAITPNLIRTVLKRNQEGKPFIMVKRFITIISSEVGYFCAGGIRSNPELYSYELGDYYESAGGPPLVNAGDKISAGQVICHIVLWGLIFEMKSKVDGYIEKVLVKNSEFVEEDQPLFQVSPIMPISHNQLITALSSGA